MCCEGRLCFSPTHLQLKSQNTATIPKKLHTFFVVNFVKFIRELKYCINLSHLFPLFMEYALFFLISVLSVHLNKQKSE